jgi:hypothetical protein
MGNKRDWHRTRSTHADVLESLERVIKAHPAGSAKRRLAARFDDTAKVVDLRPRLAVVRGGYYDYDGDDAA